MTTLDNDPPRIAQICRPCNVTWQGQPNDLCWCCGRNKTDRGRGKITYYAISQLIMAGRRHQ